MVLAPATSSAETRLGIGVHVGTIGALTAAYILFTPYSHIFKAYSVTLASKAIRILV